MQESQSTIVSWAEQTFGSAESDLRLATGVHEKLLDLTQAILSETPAEKVKEEAAGVAICLYRLAAVLGADLDRRTQHALFLGVAKDLVPESNSTVQAVLRAETNLVIAKNKIADGMPLTRIVQEVTAVRVILEEVVARLGGSLTEAIDAKMAINRSRVWRLDGTGQECVPKTAG